MIYSLRKIGRETMSYYHPKYQKEATALRPEIKAAVVHLFLEKVQRYSEEMIERKSKEMKKRKKIDPEAIEKWLHWIHYHRFNQIALEEIEDGTLDAWFTQ